MSTVAEEVKLLLPAGRYAAMKAGPYFGRMLHAFVPRETPGLGTVGVTAQGVLLWDPEFIAKLLTVAGQSKACRPEKRVVLARAWCGGLWLHETFHRLGRHHERRGNRDPGRWNRACDLSINPAVQAMLPLPEGELRGLFPADFGFPPGLTADAYYALLEKHEAQHGAPPPGGIAAGACGGCAGNPHPNEPKDDPDGRSEAELALADRAVAHAIDAAARAGKLPGSFPGWLKVWAETELAPPKVHWSKRLGMALSRAKQWRAGAVHHRYDAPSRRQGALGFGPGRPILPRLRAPVPQVVAAVDTSGSMRHLLAAAASELTGVLSAGGGDVEFMAIDERVHAVKKVRNIQEALRLFVGGGGTDFRPAFEELAKRRTQPDVVVFITDGYGPAPCQPPPYRVIWAVLGGGPRPAAWGEYIAIDDIEADEDNSHEDED